MSDALIDDVAYAYLRSAVDLVRPTEEIEAKERDVHESIEKIVRQGEVMRQAICSLNEKLLDIARERAIARGLDPDAL